MSKPVLVVDDPNDTLEPLARVLSAAGYAVTRIAQEAAADAFAHSPPELVLVQLHQGGGSGVTLTEQIRQRPDGAIVPIIFFGTGHEMVTSVSDALAVGGDYYFQHPIDKAKVTAKIRAYIGIGEPPDADEELTNPSITLPPQGFVAVARPQELEELDFFSDASVSNSAATPLTEMAELSAAEEQAKRRFIEEQLKHQAEAESRLSEGIGEAPKTPAVPPKRHSAAEQVLKELEEEARAQERTVADGARREAEAAAQREVEEVAKRELEARAKREAQAKREEQEQRARQAAEEAAQREIAERAKREAEEAAQREIEARAKREAELRRAAEAAAEREIQERALREAEARRAAEAAAEREIAEARARAEEAARRELEAKIQKQAEENARRELEAKLRREAEERLAAEKDAAERRAREEEAARRRIEEEARARVEAEMRKEAERRFEAEEKQRRLEAEARLAEEAERRRREQAAQRAEEEALVRRQREAVEAAAAAERARLESALAKQRAEQDARERIEAELRSQLANARPEPQRAERHEAVAIEPRAPQRTSGDLAETDIASLLAELAQERISGKVRFSRPGSGVEKIIGFDDGRPVEIVSSDPSDRLEEFLLREHLLTRPQYQTCRLKQVSNPRQLGAFVVTEGFLKAQELFDVVRRHFEDSLHSLFDWQEGSFAFIAVPVLPEDRIVLPQSPERLVAEGIKRRYPLPRLIAQIGGPSSLLLARTSERPLDFGFDPKERQLHKLLDGAHSIEDLVFSQGMGEERVYQVLYALLVFDQAEVAVRGVEGQGSADAHGAGIDRARIKEQAQQANSSDYFDFLGIARHATEYEIERAIGAVRRAFSPERFSPDIARELQAELKEIDRVLCDAEYVLKDARLRDAYLRHRERNAS